MAQKSSATTRSSSNAKLIAIVGPGKEFIPSEVPTLRSVIQKGILMQQDNLHNGIPINCYPLMDIAKELVQLILAQWQISNDDFKPPVTKHEKTIADTIVAKWGTLRKVAQDRANKRERESIKNCLDKLFDITTCQCIIYLCNDEEANCSGCNLGAHIFCKCKQDQKIPKIELKWLYFQRQKIGEKSNLQMSVNDSKETGRKLKRMIRKVGDMRRELKVQNIIEDTVIFENSSGNSANSNISAENQPASSVQNRIFKITNTACATQS